MKRNRFIYTLLSLGVIGTFFGHGMWAIDGKESFVKLFTGTFDNVFGVSVSVDTGTAWVKGIGWFDLAIAAILTIMLIGNVRGKGALYRFAYSPAAIVIYSWAVLWGFLTAGSRVTAVGEFYPEVWDVVERAPNFVLPAVLIYMVYQHRLDHTPTRATTVALKSTQMTAR